MKPFLERLEESVLLSDGAMGTQLQGAGLEAGGCGEKWNIDHPEKILAIQKAYVEAGSDCLTTNTFGGCRVMLERHGLEDRVEEVNQAAVRIARQAFGQRPGYVIGDIGPFGGLMEPYGEVSAALVRAAFREQAKALVSAGADAIIIETQTCLEELQLGIEAALEQGAPCVIASVAFDVTVDGSEARTMMGVDPEQAVEFIQKMGAHVAALNCGTGIEMTWAARIARRYRKVCDLPIMAQPNAGSPVLERMKVVYKQSPEEMSAGVTELMEAGARVIGGCCGSTPAHIRLFRKRIDEAARRETTGENTNS